MGIQQIVWRRCPKPDPCPTRKCSPSKWWHDPNGWHAGDSPDTGGKPIPRSNPQSLVAANSDDFREANHGWNPVADIRLYLPRHTQVLEPGHSFLFPAAQHTQGQIILSKSNSNTWRQKLGNYIPSLTGWDWLIGGIVGVALILATILISQGLYIKAKAMLAQVLLNQAWAETMETNEPTRP